MDILAELKKAEQDLIHFEEEMQRLAGEHAAAAQKHAQALVVRDFLKKHVSAPPPAPKAPEA